MINSNFVELLHKFEGKFKFCRILKTIFIFLISLVSLPFRQFSTNEGIPQVTIYAITQDLNGHIWLGTDDGLCRLSGFHTQTYRSGASDEGRSLLSDEIRSLFTDSNGKIWISCQEGVCIHTPGSEKFEKFTTPMPNASFLDLRSENKAENYGLFIAASDRHIFELDADSLCTRKKWTFDDKITDLDYCEGKIMAAVAGKGIFEWRPEDGLRPVLPQPGNCGLMAVCGDGDLWTISNAGECILRSIADKNTKRFNLSRIVSGLNIRSLETDTQGRLWIATYEGIVIVEKDGSVSVQRHSTTNGESLGDNSVRTIFRSNDGGMWVGTFYSGAYYYHPDAQMIRSISARSISDGDNIICRTIKEDPSSGKIWIGSANLGLLVFNPSDRSVRQLRPYTNYDETVNSIEFVPDKNKTLLGMTGAGVEIISGGERTRVLNGLSIFGITRFSDNLFLVCSTDGVYTLDINDDTTRQFLYRAGSGRANFTAIDPETGELWVGFRYCIVRASLTTDRKGYPVYTAISRYDIANNVCDILFDEKSIRFATSEGVLDFHREDESWTKITMEDGLPSNLIRGFETDSQGKLWISTESGLAFQTSANDKIRVRGRREGLKALKFNPFAHCKASDGTLYFGGTGNIYALEPTAGHSEREPVSPKITGIKVNGAPLTPSSLINLNASDRDVEITLDMADFKHQQSVILEYKMDGIDKDWKIADESFTVSYTSIPEGRHLFEVRTVGEDGTESRETQAMTIIVKPAWYKSGSLMTCLLLVCVAVTAAAFIIQEKRNREEIRKIKKQAKLDVSKVRAEGLATRPMQAKDREFIIKIIDIVDRNIGNDKFGVQELADALGMSRSNLNLRLKTIADTTPLDLIRKIRMEKVFKMLLNGDYPISEVASATGFSSATYFATYFHKETGLTPRQWIARNKG